MNIYWVEFVDGSKRRIDSDLPLDSFLDYWQRYGFIINEKTVYMFHAVVCLEQR